jgi:mannose-6-phosphate isomerase-like protein (cupin superfamily)
MMCDRVRVPLSFDAGALFDDVRRLPESAWERHFNTAYYEGDWSGAALRSSGGRIGLYAEPAGQNAFEDTVLLDACPNIRSALTSFRCSLNSVRLLRLGRGARVREHRDYGLEFDSGEARFHVPITCDGAEFILDGRRVPMSPGECWYVDVNRPHSVANCGPDARVHLVIDCIVNDWLKGLLSGAASRD